MVMRVTVCHSHQDRCGIREYGQQLDRSLVDAGVYVRKCSYAYLGEVVAELEPGSIFLVHFEPGLTTPWYLNQYLVLARNRGAKTVMCCHWYDHEYMSQYEDNVDCFVLHRDYSPKSEKSVFIPLGCPVYRATKENPELRTQFGLPLDATVLTTIGFLTRWKSIPELAMAMLNAIAGHPKLHVRIHTPWPYDDAGAGAEEASVRAVMNAHGCKNMSFSKEFLPEHEALDLAHASDLGFVFHGFHTRSVSAATKQFVSAGRPLVVTGSSHASDLRMGVVRIGSFDPAEFAREVVSVATNTEAMAGLQRDATHEYDRLNMDVVAKQYVELFEQLLR